MRSIFLIYLRNAIICISGSLVGQTQDIPPRKKISATVSTHMSQTYEKRLLYNTLSHALPTTKLLEDYHYSVDPTGGLRVLELDVWIPERRCAFEYQGILS